MGDRRPLVVAGASAAGLTVAEGLRAEGYEGPIVLIGDEPHAPYDRPPLSKQGLTEGTPPNVFLAGRDDLDELGVELLTGRACTGLDVTGRRVFMTEGSVDFDHLVIATGVRPRRFPAGHELRGVHTLRSLADATALRESLGRARRVVVVGGGFLGAEVATAARTLRLEVTWLFPEPTPMGEVLGPELGSMFEARHRAAGVDVHTQVAVRAIVGENGVVTGVEDETGVTWPADVVVVCIGSIPNVEWLCNSGLGLTDGVDCDAFGGAADRIHAAGDVASWMHPLLGRPVRFEHRMNATEQGRVVAHNIVHGPRRTLDAPPYFWTDQYDARLQVYGFPAGATEFEVTEGAVAEGRFAGCWRLHGRPVAVGGMGLPRAVRELRSLLAAAATTA